eukprot:CAMPEP_0179900898 /NCGR_PEP_ID=MMETSP0982-20121206/39414_1 /TAXON_ID=483367 /ORGANISM="non described non described, Strain CCMP 2436" /LENGTH=182 /DNA_ID=CAMNT_0021799285 /DNA_START=232 /DNA_END=781 /DNA_ORIENTATION=+
MRATLEAVTAALEASWRRSRVLHARGGRGGCTALSSGFLRLLLLHDTRFDRYHSHHVLDVLAFVGNRLLQIVELVGDQLYPPREELLRLRVGLLDEVPGADVDKQALDVVDPARHVERVGERDEHLVLGRLLGEPHHRLLADRVSRQRGAELHMTRHVPLDLLLECLLHLRQLLIAVALQLL